jgi:hypothetical protein
VSFATAHYPGDGTPGQSACHAGENLIMAGPSNKADPPASLLLHVPGGAGQFAPRCSSPPGGPLPRECSRRNLRSCEAEPPVEVARATA